MIKVFVVNQLRKYANGEIKQTEVQSTVIDEVAKIRNPYFIAKPKNGIPYEVIGKSTITVKTVPKITHPLDDLPGA